MLILLFDGAPSVPKDTQMLASSISLIGANPSMRIAEAGQWDTLTPASESNWIWREYMRKKLEYQQDRIIINYWQK